MNKYICGWVCAMLLLGGARESVSSATHEVTVSIASRSLGDALNEFGQQSGLHVVLFSELGSGLTAPAIEGKFTAQEVLARLLAGSGLWYKFIDARTVAVLAKPFRMARAEAAAPLAETTGSEKMQVEEIVVTATKRSESVQDIPMSVAVLRNQDIERRGLIGMEDYLRGIPGVNQIDRGGRDNAIVIRGITTSPQNENFFSGTTVASYFDETPITGAAGAGAGGIDVRPVDIERIEILRGPQGTGYGSSSLGGTLRMIPAKPKLDAFGAKVAASWSNTSGAGDDNSMVQGTLNAPVIEGKLALRAVGYRYDESGFYRNIAGLDPLTISASEGFGLGDYVRGYTQDDVGRMRSTGGRLAALWEPMDQLNLLFTHLTQKIEQDGQPLALVGEFDQAAVPIAPQGRLRGETGEVADTDMDLTSLVLSYDMAWGQLTAATSWVDSGAQLASATLRAFLPGSGPSSSTARGDFESFTAETRVASHLDGPFQILGGLFYERIEEAYFQVRDWPGPPQTNPVATNPQFLLDNTRELEQRAVFGELSYELTRQLTATVGGRFFTYDKDQTSLTEGMTIPIGGGVTQVLDSSEDGSSFKASLSYKPTTDSLLYASWAEGFRLGRPDVGLTSSANLCDQDGDGLVDGSALSIESTRTIDSDFLDNYELGAKAALFDRRVTLDLAVYHIEWDGLPVRALAPGCNVPYTANAGAATSDGVELQANVLVSEGLRMQVGAAYTKAELSEDAPGLGARTGARLPGSPKVNASLGAEYEFPLLNHRAFVRSDAIYVGEFHGDLLQTPATRSGNYVKLDARAGVAIRDLNVELFVRNLTNRDAVTTQSTFGTYRLRPRTVGVQLGYQF